jgi:hypothetical protein
MTTISISSKREFLGGLEGSGKWLTLHKSFFSMFAAPHVRLM